MLLLVNPPVDSSLADLIKAILWPLVTAAALVVFRQPIGAFLTGISSRASKLSAFGASVELASLPTARALNVPYLDELKSGTGTVAGDSSRGILSTLADAAPADYIAVNLGGGDEWLTTRLFILAVLIPRVRPIKRLVFLNGPDLQFFGISTPEAVARALAAQYDWLEPAYVSSFVNLVESPTPNVYVMDEKTNNFKMVGNQVLQYELRMQPGRSLLGGLPQDVAQMVLNEFLGRVRVYTDPQKPDWVGFAGSTYYQASWEHAEWVSADKLLNLLGTNLNPKFVLRDPAEDGAVAARTLLRHDDDYVPIVDMANRFYRLVNRKSAADDLVRKTLTQAG